MWDKVVRNVLQAVGLVSMIIVFHIALMSGLCPTERYSAADDVDAGFSIAIRESGVTAVVPWSQYQQDPAAYGDRLVRVADVVPGLAADTLKLDVEGDVITVFNLADGSNRSWSSYRLSGNTIEPVSFKLPQRFYVYSLFAAALMFWLLKFLYERRFPRTRQT